MARRWTVCVAASTCWWGCSTPRGSSFTPVEKLQARAGALTFLSEQLPRTLEELLAAKVPDDQGQALIDSYLRYRAMVAQRFPERPPALQPIEQVLGVAQEAKRLPPFPTPDKDAKAEEPAASPGSDDPLLAPIPGASPVGKDPKLSDDFDALYTEIEKIAAIDGGRVDWAMVRDASAKILSSLGKDLRCLCYWTVARMHLDKIAGLREGLSTLATGAERFGDDIFPTRPKARAAALAWMGTRIEEDLPSIAKSAPEEDLKALHASVDAIEKAMGGRAASLEGVQRARGALMSVKTEKPKPAKPAAPAAAPKPAAGAAATPKAAAPPPPPAAAVPPELESLVEQMLEQANDISAAGDTAISLRLRRQAMWMAEPSILQGRKYDCESLGMKPRMEVDGIFKKKEWGELIQRTEELFPSYPYCLDLTVWAGKAAAELLGEEAALALASELVALSVRAPNLLRGTDRNGNPLASKEAREWINEHRGAGAPAGAPAAAPTAAAAAAPATAAAPVPVAAPETLPDEIETLFKNGQAAEAMRRASAAAVGLTGRAGFQRNLLLAERLLDNRSGALALPLFRALLGQLRTTSLTQWEPAVGARCIRGYLQCARSSNAKIEDERELIDELMLLDPSLAVGLV